MRFSTIPTAAALLSLTSAKPVVYPRAVTPSNTTEPCAAVSSAYFATPAPFPTVPAQLAYDCIKSVPLNVTSAKILLAEIRPYINWQSTLAFLKNPPAEYVAKIQEAVDVFAGLDEIEGKVDSGELTAEYDVSAILSFAGYGTGHWPVGTSTPLLQCCDASGTSERRVTQCKLANGRTTVAVECSQTNALSLPLRLH
jgi:hypothetical protein